MSIKYDLITRNLQEYTDPEVLRSLSETKDLSIYWGTATTGKPHLGYYVPLLKIRDFLLANCRVTILLADIHAFLDNLKAPIDLVTKRCDYYEMLLKQMLISIRVDISCIKFVRGSEFQLSQPYVFDLLKLTTLTTQRNSIKAGAQVVKQVDNPLLSSMIYPLMQSLDEEYLKADCELGGVDQRKIFMFARKYLPLLGYNKRIHLMTPMIPGLSSTAPERSNIDLEKLSLGTDGVTNNSGSNILEQNAQKLGDPLFDSNLTSDIGTEMHKKSRDVHSGEFLMDSTGSSQSSQLHSTKSQIDSSQSPQLHSGESQIGSSQSPQLHSGESQIGSSQSSQLHSTKSQIGSSQSSQLHPTKSQIDSSISVKMSSSVESSKIDILDTKKQITNKITKCYLKQGEDTSLFDTLKHIILPIMEIHQRPFRVDRKDQQPFFFNNYDELIDAFHLQKIHPKDLKQFISHEINEIIQPVRDNMQSSLEVIEAAYGNSKDSKKKKKGKGW